MDVKKEMTRVARGGLFGLAATGAMSIVFLAGQRLGTIGKLPPQLIIERIFRAQKPITQQVALIAHLSYGAAAGSVFSGLRQRGLRRGVLFGLGVWATSYELWVPGAGVIPPAHKDNRTRALTILIAHMVFGATLGAISRPYESK